MDSDLLVPKSVTLGGGKTVDEEPVLEPAAQAPESETASIADSLTEAEILKPVEEDGEDEEGHESGDENPAETETLDVPPHAAQSTFQSLLPPPPNWKLQYDQEVAQHTATKEALADKARALADMRKDLDESHAELNKIDAELKRGEDGIEEDSVQCAIRVRKCADNFDKALANIRDICGIAKGVSCGEIVAGVQKLKDAVQTYEGLMLKNGGNLPGNPPAPVQTNPSPPKESDEMGKKQEEKGLQPAKTQVVVETVPAQKKETPATSVNPLEKEKGCLGILWGWIPMWFKIAFVAVLLAVGSVYYIVKHNDTSDPSTVDTAKKTYPADTTSNSGAENVDLTKLQKEKAKPDTSDGDEMAKIKAAQKELQDEIERGKRLRGE